jgi:DNA-binding MarR family transcriptional regulator
MDQSSFDRGFVAEQEIARIDEELYAIKRSLCASSSNPAGERAVALTQVRALIAARRLRETMISRELFADAAWDILLELYSAWLEQRRVSTSELCVASAVPATTALRWIDKLESLSLLKRTDDPLDGRRIWVELSADGEARMRSFFRQIL